MDYESLSREELIAEARRLAGQAERAAAAARQSRDELTGFYGQDAFLLLVGHQVHVARRAGRPMLLICCTVDDLAHVEQAFGRGAGERALSAAARIVSHTYRESDIVGRTGEDEFAVLALDACAAHEELLVGRLLDQLTGWKAEASGPYELAMSVGAAEWDPRAPCGVEELLERARASMRGELPTD